MVMDRQAVMALLPHRSPMLLVDTVTALVPMSRIETRFYVDPEWVIFQGHFPADPVMPGVLSVECMAQAADIMIMTAEEYARKTPLFAGIDRVRFTKKIVPGDTVTAEAVVTEVDARKAKITCSAKLLTGGEAAAWATLVIAMR